MNRKERLAVVFIVIAIVLLFTSLVIGISVDLAKERLRGEKSLSESSNKGEVSLEIIRAHSLIGGIIDYGIG
jgi:flagellar basal body-associated protein FliL